MAALGTFLLLGTPEDTVWLPYVIVGVAVVAGSLVWGDRVAKTLIGHTPQQRGHRLKAHAATAVLISAGAYFGDAFSTTHVSDGAAARSEEHTSELQSHSDIVCRLLLEKKKHDR